MSIQDFQEALVEYLKLVNHDVNKIEEFDVKKMWYDYTESDGSHDIYTWIKANLVNYVKGRKSKNVIVKPESIGGGSISSSNPDIKIDVFYNGKKANHIPTPLGMNYKVISDEDIAKEYLDRDKIKLNHISAAEFVEAVLEGDTIFDEDDNEWFICPAGMTGYLLAHDSGEIAIPPVAKKYDEEGNVTYLINGAGISFPIADNKDLIPLGVDGVRLIDICIDRLIDRRDQLLNEISDGGREYEIKNGGEMNWDLSIETRFDIKLGKIKKDEESK